MTKDGASFITHKRFESYFTNKTRCQKKGKYGELNKQTKKNTK